MKAYFDTNILIYLEDGILDLDNLINKIDKRIAKIFYSSAHLQEAIEIKGTEEERNQRINKRLRTIELVTKSNYLQVIENNVDYQMQNPAIVLETISVAQFANDAMKVFTNLITGEQKEMIRQELGLDSLNLNNYNTTEIVMHLNKKLQNWGTGYSLLDMIEMGISLHPDGHTFGLSHRIAGIFELLDMFGYWKDKVNKKSNYARHWDSSHTYFASFCDYFISDDKRTRKKARVVYEIYKIETEVVSSKRES